MKYVATLLLILGFGLSAFGQTIKSLGYNTTNGQVVYSGTNQIIFTNKIFQSNSATTNVSEVRLITKSNSLASWFVYDSASLSTNTNDAKWTIQLFGINHTPSGLTGYGLEDGSAGAASLTIENMFYASYLPSPSHVAEFYFNVHSYITNGVTRAFAIGGSQTNSQLGTAYFNYPLTINYNTNSRSWNGGDDLGLNVRSQNSGELAKFVNADGNGTAQIYLFSGNYATIFQSSRYTTQIFNNTSGRSAFRVDSNGVVYGSLNYNKTPEEAIHLDGNTFINGNLSFANTTNSATTRTNLGLGTTNEVTFSRLRIVNTNVGSFEGLANLINSNNTTLSNETLFRVGLAEQNNRSAQFGFRVARTNNGGEGFAAFSVYGYNALMMIGPSDRSRLNTNVNAAIEADIYSINETNKVMTLITTNTGATLFHRPVEFASTNDASVSRTNLGLGATWLTNTNVTTFLSDIGLGSTNTPQFQGIQLSNSVLLQTDTNNNNALAVRYGGQYVASMGEYGLYLYNNDSALSFGTNNTTGAAISRDNLGFTSSMVVGSRILEASQSAMPTNILFSYDITNNVSTNSGATVTAASNISSSDIVAGSGTTLGNTATTETWNRTFTSYSDPLTAQLSNQFMTWTTVISNGSVAVINGLSGMLLKRSSSGPDKAELYYSLNGSNFFQIGNTFTVTTTNTSAASAFGSVLSNNPIVVLGSNTITWRLVAYGGTNSRFGIANTNTNDLSILGYLASPTNTVALQPASAILTGLSTMGGLNRIRTFNDQAGNTNVVTVSNGIIVNWTVNGVQ